jgi:multiple sugar transport system permease protein
VSSSVALIAAWLIMLSGDGLVNAALGGLAPDPTWLINRGLVIPVIGAFCVIKWLGFYVVVYLAALQAVPREQYEAAALDGAGPLRRFWYVSVPGVRRTTALVAILTVVNAANLFTEPFLMTGQGGPAGASTSPVLLIYQQGIQQGDVGYAAAMGVLLTILVMAISAGAGRMIERD